MDERKPDDKMTVVRIVEDYQIGENTVRKMFRDDKLPVQKYCNPQFVLRSELLKYFTERHDYLSERD